MPLNTCLLKPYLGLATSSGQSLLATQCSHSTCHKICPCYMWLPGEHLLSAHPHCPESFEVSKLTFLAAQGGICVWIAVYIENCTLLDALAYFQRPCWSWFHHHHHLRTVLSWWSHVCSSAQRQPSTALKTRLHHAAIWSHGSSASFFYGNRRRLCRQRESMHSFVQPEKNTTLFIFCLCLIWIIFHPTLFFPILQVVFHDKCKKQTNKQTSVFFLGCFFFERVSLSVLCIVNLQEDKQLG